MVDWIIFALVAIFVVISLFILVCAVFGFYKFKYILNRMNAGGMVDSLGLLAMVIGLIIANGFTMVSLKLLFIVIAMWVTSPISGHLISKMEYITNEKIEEEVKVNKEVKKDDNSL